MRNKLTKISNRIWRPVRYLKYGEIHWSVDSSKYTEFKDIDEILMWSMYYYEWSQKYKKNMLVAEKVLQNKSSTSVLEWYFGHSYRGINEYLRFGENGIYNNTLKDALSIFGSMVNALAIVLSMAPRIPNNIVVYRLVCDEFIESLIENNKNNGRPTQEKGFISASLLSDIVNVDEHYASHRHLLKIYVKAGTVGVYANHIANRSEQELLLYPNGYFQLVKSPYKSGDKIVYECNLVYF